MMAVMAAEGGYEEQLGRAIAVIFNPASCGAVAAVARMRGHSAASVVAAAFASGFSVTAESLPSSPVATS